MIPSVLGFVSPFVALASQTLADFVTLLMREEGFAVALPVTILLYNKLKILSTMMLIMVAKSTLSIITTKQ